jgi:hypothetical protein
VGNFILPTAEEFEIAIDRAGALLFVGIFGYNICSVALGRWNLKMVL